MTDNTQQAALKPCPFCGRAAKAAEHDPIRGRPDEFRTYYAYCTNYGSKCPGVHGTHKFDTIEEAVEAWNARARTPAPVDHAALAVENAAACKWPVCHASAQYGCYTCPATVVHPLQVGFEYNKAASDGECAGYVEGWNACLSALRAHPAGGVGNKLERMLLDLLARIHGDGGQYSASHGLDKSYHDANLVVANIRAAGMTQPPSGYVSEYNGGRVYSELRPTSIPDACIFPVWRQPVAGVDSVACKLIERLLHRMERQYDASHEYWPVPVREKTAKLIAEGKAFLAAAPSHEKE